MVDRTPVTHLMTGKVGNWIEMLVSHVSKLVSRQKLLPQVTEQIIRPQCCGSKKSREPFFLVYGYLCGALPRHPGLRR